MNVPLKLFCGAYINLVNAFKSGDNSNLQSVVQRHKSTYINDQNMGLVKKVVDNQVKARIQNLTKTFMTLSLTDFANRVNLSGPVEAEAYLVEMIQAGTIFARINQADSTVHFLDDPEHFDSKNMLAKVNKKMDECISLEKQLMSMSDQMVLSLIYTRRVLEMEAKSSRGFNQY